MAAELRRSLQRETVEGPGGTTDVRVDLLVNEDGDFVLEGQDLGALPREIFGDSDYEFWLTVDRADTDALLRALSTELEESRAQGEKEHRLLQLAADLLGASDTPRTDLARWLDRQGVPYTLHSW